ncbi:hypothetical protein CU098_006549 [Rhizopus stolonifer]|uniref:BRISC and BRCA1-A complex member 2 n=1 Tax=Rhizopus stolonifer TaxID=4846 RepID=A0A367J0X5_RHIST|nr:hypothetical protein CU098_006549 [Rhizopus stolonifer]
MDIQLSRAIAKLSLLDSIKMVKKLTCHYSFEKEHIEDRFDICIADKIDCQIVFDSSNYRFPPDLIFRNRHVKELFDVDDVASLLPDKEWNINDEDCLYDWFERILTTVKQDALQQDTRKKRSTLDPDADHVSKRRKPAMPDLSDDEKDVFQKKSSCKLDNYPIFTIKQSTTSERKSNMDSCVIPPNAIQKRKECVMMWIKKFRDQIIRYDPVEFRHFTLYLNFKIAQDTALWKRYYQLKRERLTVFQSIHNDTDKHLARPKPFAPMIVHFQMNHDFPISKIKVKLISVLNTTEVKSSDPDTKIMHFRVNSMEDMIQDIMPQLTDHAIRFHLLQQQP